MPRLQQASLLTVLLAFACSDSDEPRGTGTANDAGSGDTSGAADTDATETTDASETGVDPSSTSSTSTSTTTSATTTTDDPTAADASTSTDDGSDASCPAGTEGCPCDQGSCGGQLLCVEDLCEEPLQCAADSYEPNDSEETAIFLGEINDCDWNGDTIEAVLSWGDEDWFTYTGTDAWYCVVNPEREIAADGDLRLCKFAECLNGLENTKLTCPPGTKSETSPAGRPGCCSSSGFKWGVFDCDGTSNDTAHIYLRVDQGAQQCVQYTLSYHY